MHQACALQIGSDFRCNGGIVTSLQNIAVLQRLLVPANPTDARWIFFSGLLQAIQGGKFSENFAGLGCRNPTVSGKNSGLGAQKPIANFTLRRHGSKDIRWQGHCASWVSSNGWPLWELKAWSQSFAQFWCTQMMSVHLPLNPTGRKSACLCRSMPF